jgi:hypothetical protein
MKNKLAENLLRFGVKNLSEANIKTLQEQNPNATPPAGATKPSTTAPAGTTTPAAKPAAQNQRFEATFNTRQNNKDVPGSVVGFAMKQPDGSFKPGYIIVRYPGMSSVTSFSLINSNGVYILDPRGTGALKKPGDLAQAIKDYKLAPIRKGLLPVTAVKQVIANIGKATKTSLKLDPTLEQAFAISWMNSAVSKSINGTPTGVLAPFKTASLVLHLNPETGVEMYRELWLGRSNMYSYAKASNGKVGPNGSGRANDALKLPPERTPEINQAVTDLYNQLEAQAGTASK